MRQQIQYPKYGKLHIRWDNFASAAYDKAHMFRIDIKAEVDYIRRFIQDKTKQ